MDEAMKRFLKDVNDHNMEVVRNDGVYRHIRFRNPACFAYHFDLITWPGHLCATGDMGTWVFSRLPDMFTFFRGEKELSINPGYWAEKLLAVDKNFGPSEYSVDRLKEVISEYLDAYTNDWKSERMLRVKSEIEEQLRHDVLGSESEESACKAASDFEFLFKDDDGVQRKFVMADFWENDITDWTHRFIWILYAIVWGIQKFDARRQS